MAIGLFTQDEAFNHLYHRIKAKKHWVFIPNSQSSHVVCEIENQFYSGKNSTYFEAFAFLLPGLNSIYIGLKKVLSVADLAKFSHVSTEVLEERDILFILTKNHSKKEEAEMLYIQDVFLEKLKKFQDLEKRQKNARYR